MPLESEPNAEVHDTNDRPRDPEGNEEEDEGDFEFVHARVFLRGKVVGWGHSLLSRGPCVRRVTRLRRDPLPKSLADDGGLGVVLVEEGGDLLGQVPDLLLDHLLTREYAPGVRRERNVGHCRWREHEGNPLQVRVMMAVAAILTAVPADRTLVDVRPIVGHCRFSRCGGGEQDLLSPSQLLAEGLGRGGKLGLLPYC